MKDQDTIQKFIELRAQGWTYARLITELNVSKPTLRTRAGLAGIAFYLRISS